MRNEIADQYIIAVSELAADKYINPNYQVYVFNKADGSEPVGMLGPSEQSVRAFLTISGHELADLLRVEPQTFEGCTYTELMEEGRKRGLFND